MTVKVLVCRVGGQPQVEECASPFHHIKEILADPDNPDPMIQVITLDDGVELYSDEEGAGVLPFNRAVPARAAELPYGFTMADVINPSPEFAMPGEMGEHHIYGPFLLARHDFKKDQPLTLTDDDLAKWTFNLYHPARS